MRANSHFCRVGPSAREREDKAQNWSFEIEKEAGRKPESVMEKEVERIAKVLVKEQLEKMVAAIRRRRTKQQGEKGARREDSGGSSGTRPE